MTNERDEVAAVATAITAAIAARDVSVRRTLMAPGFVHRAHGSSGVDTDAFLLAVEQIPGDIMFVRLEQVEVDLSPTGALVSGFQRAQV